MHMKLDQTLKLKLVKIAQIALGMLLVLDLILHFTSMQHAPQIPLPSVVVKKPTLENRVEYITQTGNTVAYNSVDLVARVAGYLDAIQFTDGTLVKKDQKLFIIEQEPYMAKLKEAKASLAAQKAIQAYDNAEYARQKRMYKENATSLNNVEKWLAKSQESAAEIDKAVANVEIASINYSYTQVLSPFDGRIGRHLVDMGNYVGNGVATKLATVEQISPLYVYFNLNELDLIKLRTATRVAGLQKNTVKPLPVFVSLQDVAGVQFEGQLDFVDTGLNASTGTMEFRALLPNKEKLLVPGLFVQVRVAVSKPTPQLTVPDTAVLYDQIGAYLLVVDSQNKVQLKRVTTAGLEQGQRAIASGIDAQDNVIVSGLQNATPGNQVAPETEASAT